MHERGHYIPRYGPTDLLRNCKPLSRRRSSLTSCSFTCTLQGLHDHNNIANQKQQVKEEEEEEHLQVPHCVDGDNTHTFVSFEKNTLHKDLSAETSSRRDLQTEGGGVFSNQPAGLFRCCPARRSPLSSEVRQPLPGLAFKVKDGKIHPHYPMISLLLEVSLVVVLWRWDRSVGFWSFPARAQINKGCYGEFVHCSSLCKICRSDRNTFLHMHY